MKELETIYCAAVTIQEVEVFVGWEDQTSDTNEKERK